YDNISKIAGNHSLKFGGSLLFQGLNADNQTFFGGRFSFGQAIPIANLLGSTAAAQAANPINGFLLACPGAPGKTSACPSGDCIGDFQRDANNRIIIDPVTGRPLPKGNGVADVLEGTLMTSLQSFNLGLPTVFQAGFGDPIAKGWTNRYGFYAQDTWKVRQNLTLNYGLRYVIHDEPFIIPTYKKDFQPRAGFSWDPWKDGKTVIRGGAGIFTGPLNNAIANVTSELAGTTDPTSLYIVLGSPTSGGLGLSTSFAGCQRLLPRC